MHCRHVSDDDALCVTEYVPILHKLQYHRPADVEKVPVGHSAQLPEPAAE